MAGIFAAALFLLPASGGAQARAGPEAVHPPDDRPDESPAAAHLLLVAGESADRVDLVRFDGQTVEVVRSVQVGRWPTEIDGPHGLAADPASNRWYVTIAHGNPFGYLAAYEGPGDPTDSSAAASMEPPVAEIELGLFPATVDATAGGGLVFVANFDLHGDPVPGSVSVVDAGTMQEIARIETCVRPHGSRLTEDGRFHYSVCVGDDELVEIDVRRLAVARRLSLGDACAPTWTQASPDGARIYVACNGRDEVLEIDAGSWSVGRRFSTGSGPYNLEVTGDGRLLVVTYKGGRAVGIWDLERGVERARVETTRRLPHGVALSPDGRYAFVSVEGVGGEPGAVDILDLTAGRRVRSVDVGKQAGGIAYWGNRNAREPEGSP